MADDIDMYTYECTETSRGSGEYNCVQNRCDDDTNPGACFSIGGTPDRVELHMYKTPSLQFYRYTNCHVKETIDDRDLHGNWHRRSSYFMCDGEGEDKDNNLWIDRTKYYDQGSYGGMIYSHTAWHINFQPSERSQWERHQMNTLTFDLNPRKHLPNAFPDLIWES